MKRAWRDLSVSKKLYIVVGVMGLLIAIELLTLRFAMNTLSSVRAFVGGEGLWSKAQKSAVLHLHKYAGSKDPAHFQNYLQALQVPMGDRQARLELAKENFDASIVTEGLLQGGIDAADIPGVIQLVRRFHEVPHLRRALEIWAEGDRLLGQFRAEAQVLHERVAGGAGPAGIQQSLARIDELDGQLTLLENNFSYALGDASRWMEGLLLTVLLIAVLTIEGTGLLLTVSFSRRLSNGLRELQESTVAVGKGDFSKRIPIRSQDELGQLAASVNTMAAQLESQIGGRRQAEEASEIKNQFLAHVSHEIRTPLSAMLGFAELLKDKKLSESERDSFIEIILQTGKSLCRLLNDVLDLSKVEAGQMDIEKLRVSLPALLEEVRQVMDMKAREKNLKIRFEKDPSLPEWVMTDPLRLRQILMNLIGNAIKFTDKGEILVTAKAAAPDLLFTVKDSGIGLGPEEREHIFEAFSQGKSGSEKKGQGSGLGLSISRQLANLLGGDVKLERSSPGEGSLFSIRIAWEAAPPALQSVSASPSPSAASEAPASPAPPSSPATHLKGKNILVVDDTPDNRFLIERILTRNGLRVEHAENGEEGVRKALGGNFDLILMDVQMPVMDGYTATRTLRENQYEKPIVAVTAHAMKGDRTKCLEAGYSEYLTKPIQVNEFMKVISELLAS